jgi:hypothetical protein
VNANKAELDLASLAPLLQSVRRHPHDRALRLRAAQAVAILAEHVVPADLDDGDKLLVEAVTAAKLLRRALDRANKADDASSDDIAAFTAWIDALHGLLLKVIERPAER